MAENAYPYDTSLVRELLKQKRKARGIRSCFPCRHRKVRCDGQVPCSSCLKRNHPELCRVPTNSGGEQKESCSASGVTPQVTAEVNWETSKSSVEDSFSHESSSDLALIISRLEKIEEQISSLKADLRAATGISAAPTAATVASTSPFTGTSPDTANQDSHQTGGPQVGIHSKSPGRHVVEDATGATIFLGSRSDLPLALGCREASVAGDLMLHDAMIDQFVPRTYPFTSLWGAEASVMEVCETLPDDSDIIRYWQAYQSTSYPFYPILVSVEHFGQSLFSFINRRALLQETRGKAEDPNPSWLALLFAVLACGVQFSDDPTQERDLRSKVFICSSFHCLRMSNFFNHTDLDQIQAMALIGHCLRNNLDTNSAWILMGATIRLAQSIGLHELSPSLPSSEQFQRNRLWWALVWQDTFLSFTYDRPPSSSITRNCPIPYTPKSKGLSFHECIFTLCQIILDQNQLETSRTPVDSLTGTLDYKKRLEGIWDAAAPFLTSKAYCTSLQDHLDRLALAIHLGYSICRVSRVYLDALMPSSPLPDTAVADCRQRAVQVVESFLELHRLSPRVCRSWAFVHNAMSCAITLHSLRNLPLDSHQNPEGLVLNLVSVLEKEAKDSEWCDADTNVRYYGPYSRAVKALKEIYNNSK